MALLSSDIFVNADEKPRSDPKVKVKTVAAWATMGVNKRLEACASVDPQHITPGASQIGPHVAIIHQALERLAASSPIAVPPSGVPSSDGGERRAHNAAVVARAEGTR